MRKPFLLIAGYDYYPSRDTEDWKGCFETYEDAMKEFNSYRKNQFDWYEIVDLRDWVNE